MSGGLPWLKGPFVGWEPGWTPPWRRGWRVLGEEDTVGIYGIPRLGKSAGVIIPQAMLHDGPMVIASTKTDVLRTTGDRRLQRAHQRGGGVYLFAPLATGSVLGLEPMGLGLVDLARRPAEAMSLAHSLVFASTKGGAGVSDGQYWSQQAEKILRGCFYAAALSNSSLRQVRTWVTRMDMHDPAEVLERSQAPGGREWAESLRSFDGMGSKERASCFAQAQTGLGCLELPEVAAYCERSTADLDEILLTGSTVFLVAAGEHQRLVAPLIATFVERIAQRAMALWNAGRLRERLLLSLDELANLAPIPSLVSILSEGAGQGVLTTYAVQDWDQFSRVYGKEAASAIFATARAKLIFGGSMNASALGDLEKLLGTEEVRKVSRSRNGGSSSTSESWELRPRFSVGDLRAIPKGEALLIYESYRPEWVDARIAATTAPFAQEATWRGVGPRQPWPGEDAA